jgi:hypothetical protein
MAQQSEWELELEEEMEGLGELEHHEFEQPELAHEFEQHEFEQPKLAHEFEGEFETGEQFFGRIARGIGRFVRRAAPILRQVARVAAPMVGTAIGGPFGAILGRVASSALGEEELAHEYEYEFEQPELAHEFESPESAHEYEGGLEGEVEGEYEAAHEVAHEIAHHELTHHEAVAEMLAESASHEQHEGEAEAMAGASVVSALSPADRRALRRILPHLVRGTAILTRVLRRRRMTRPAVRAVPTIVRRTVQTLKRQAASGQPITRRAAGRAAAAQIRRVLGNPKACAAAIQQNVRATRTMARTRPRPVAG